MKTEEMLMSNEGRRTAEASAKINSEGVEASSGQRATRAATQLARSSQAWFGAMASGDETRVPDANWSTVIQIWALGWRRQSCERAR